MQLTPLLVGVFDTFPLSRFLDSRAGDERVRAPCIAWVARGGNGKVTLIDTGPPAPSNESRRIHNTLTVEPEHQIQNALESVSVGVEEVTSVIFTHLHFDHCGGAEVFSAARFYAMAADLRYAVAPDDRGQRIGYEAGFPGLRPAWMNIFDRIEPLDGSAEVEPGCTVIPLPGHTPGSAGVLVETSQGTVALCGDLVNRVENWDAPGGGHIAPAMHTDLQACYSSFRALEGAADRVAASHDFRSFEVDW